MTCAEAHRVAAELHDGAMQEITLARLQLDLLSARVGGDAELTDQLARLSGVLSDASKGLQRLMGDLTAGLDARTTVQVVQAGTR